MTEQNNCLEDKTKNTNSDNSNKTRTAKDIMTSVITQTLYSIPGYHILESYKDRICASLPDDCDNTALRLRTLIGASDHMIQWILTGDMSKANHRIYQVVLVFVCFEPHFIKFCDIMEVLAADNECIIELRKTLIKHLHEDNAEEATRLTSTKLFTAPDALKSATGTSNMNTSINTVDVTENLNNDVLQHVSSEYEIDHDSVALLAHNQQRTTMADSLHVNNLDIMYTSLNDDKIQSLLQTEQLLTSGGTLNGTEMNTVQENILCTANEEIAASLATNISCTDVSDDLTTELDESSSSKKQMSSLSEQDKHTKIDASEAVLELKTKAVVAEAKLDTYTDSSKEVHEILEAKDFAIVREKYNEIITCLPVNYEAMMGSLQDYLSDFQICDILSMTVGHSQEILNCLILQLKSKEDLLDFCDHLEKVQEGAGSLKVIVEQLRKETIEMIQRDSERDTSTTEKPKTIPVVPPVRPPHKYLPFHPALLVIPKTTDPFDLSLLADDSKGLAALKKCYSILIENLPSNHLISLVRLQDVAIIPEEVVDSIVPSPSAEIGNKMIINYLIGLIHTEEHIITFCSFTERMLGEFTKSICVLNLKNTVKMVMDLKENDTSITNSTNSVTQLSNINSLSSTKDAVLHNEKVEVDDKSETKYFGGTSITSIVKLTKNSDTGPPYLHESGIMTGFKQAVIIITNGNEYEETIKAVPLQNPSEGSNDEDGAAAISYVRKDIDLVKSYFKRDINKELSFTLYDGPDAQRSRNFYIESLEILFKECTTAGVTIYYTGYGEEGTGNWCFKDGTISFKDIFTLYKEYCKGKVLCIFADCCYSGQWVLDCAKSLDEIGVEACGHKAKEQGMLLKIFTSCYPNQKATLDCYITNKGMYLNEEDNSIWLYYNKKVSDTQTTHGYDFTKIHCLQMEGPTAPCRCPDIPAKCSWKWEDMVSIENDKRPSSLIYTVRGNDKGRKAWHLVLVERALLKDFKEKVDTGTIDVAKYGYVIKSGWGKDPPDDVLDKIKKYSPN